MAQEGTDFLHLKTSILPCLTHVYLNQIKFMHGFVTTARQSYLMLVMMPGGEPGSQQNKIQLYSLHFKIPVAG
jgi:hypothetical protein